MANCAAHDSLKDHLVEVKDGLEEDVLIPLAEIMDSKVRFALAIIGVIAIGEACTYLVLGMGTDPTGVSLGRILTIGAVVWLIVVRRRVRRQQRSRQTRVTSS